MSACTSLKNGSWDTSDLTVPFFIKQAAALVVQKCHISEDTLKMWG